MTESIVIAAVLAFCAVLKAARDVMNDHWDSSVFATLSGGDDTAYFGHRDTVWLRRYVGRDSGNPKLRVFTIPIVSNLAEGVWDFWHLTWSLQLVVVTAALVWLAGLAWWWTLALLALSGVVFEAFYRRVFA